MRFKLLVSVAVVTFGLSACSPGSAPGAGVTDSPVLPDTPIVEMLVGEEELFERFGNQWSTQFEAEELMDPAEMAGLYDDAAANAGESPLGPECFETLLTGRKLLAAYVEGAQVGFYDGEQGQLSVVTVYRMPNAGAAQEAIDELRSALEFCEEVAVRYPSYQVTDEETTFENAALEHFADGSSGNSTVYVSRGDLVVSAMTLVSVALTEQLAQVQLDKIQALAASPG